MKKIHAALVALVLSLAVATVPLSASAHSADPNSAELAATGTVLGAFELVVGGVGTMLLIGAVLIVLATRHTARDTSAR